MGDTILRNTSQTTINTTSTVTDDGKQLKIGTWNVRGANNEMKRERIDEHMMNQHIGILFMQETKLAGKGCTTKNFHWILGNDGGQKLVHRGLAIVIRKLMRHIIERVMVLSDNMMACEIVVGKKNVTIVNVHIPSDQNADNEFAKLEEFIRKASKNKIIILGDFNAHIGKHNLTRTDKEYIGPNLLHEQCNDNGDEIKQLLHTYKIRVVNTWKNSRTLEHTWAKKTSRSR